MKSEFKKRPEIAVEIADVESAFFLAQPPA